MGRRELALPPCPDFEIVIQSKTECVVMAGRDSGAVLQPSLKEDGESEMERKKDKEFQQSPGTANGEK